jgi:RND family efflux transporter MFP subunit
MEFMMKPKMMLPGLTLVLFIVVTGCGEKIGPGTTAPAEPTVIRAPVGVAAVTQQPFLYEAVGTITARTASTISSKLMGVVRDVHVREGDRVKKGDLLVTIDQRQVKAQLENALANAAVAEKEYLRYRQLLKEQSASQQEFDRAEAQHRQAQAAVAAAQVGQRDARVRAPYDGQVVAKMINRGDLASPGTPFLTIEQGGLFNTDLVLPERHIQAVTEGLPVKVVVPALDDAAFTGTVGRIVPSADARSRSFQVKVYMPAGPDLKSGMFARVSIPLGGTGMLLISQTAISREGQLDGVYVVDDGQIAHLRLVRTGKIVGEQIEIVSGLKQGQRYITLIPPQMRDGMKVEDNS